MAYEGYCAACTYMGENQNYGKYWCERKGEYRLACDPKCYSFCEAYRRSNTARENMYRVSQNSSSGCYLTTIMCKLLDYPDSNYYLNTLRYFRDNVMQTNSNYLPLLMTYDTVGPQIADKLENDPNNKIIAITFFNNYITRAVVAIENGKNEEAIKIYTAMTSTLAEKYNIRVRNIETNSEGIDPKTLGHGYTRRRTYKEEKRSY